MQSVQLNGLKWPQTAHMITCNSCRHLLLNDTLTQLEKCAVISICIHTPGKCKFWLHLLPLDKNTQQVEKNQQSISLILRGSIRGKGGGPEGNQITHADMEQRPLNASSSNRS